MTTIREIYYKWLFLLLSDVDEIKDEHLEEQLKMENECGDKDTGEMPGELVDFQERNTCLRPDLEIYRYTTTSFQQTKEMLDKEEADGLMQSWEKVYKYVMNKHLKKKTQEARSRTCDERTKQNTE